MKTDRSSCAVHHIYNTMNDNKQLFKFLSSGLKKWFYLQIPGDKNLDFIELWIYASVLYTTPLYNKHTWKYTNSASNKALIARYDPELKTNEGRTRDGRRQTSWLPCRCVWRLWERRSATNQPITQTTSSLLTLQLTPTMEGRWDLLLEEKQIRKQSDMPAALKDRNINKSHKF